MQPFGSLRFGRRDERSDLLQYLPVSAPTRSEVPTRAFGHLCDARRRHGEIFAFLSRPTEANGNRPDIQLIAHLEEVSFVKWNTIEPGRFRIAKIDNEYGIVA